jgi:C-terminal processing protease CtpA/Prc
MIVVFASAAVAAEDELTPDVPKLDLGPKKEPLKAGIQHNIKQRSEQKKKKKLKASTSLSPFQSAQRALLDNNRFNAQADDSMLEAQAERSIGIIGVRFVSTTGHPPVINTVFPGTPAAGAGLTTNDLIVAIDGVPTSGLSRDECYDLIIGTPNTPVTLSLRRGQSFFVRTMNRMDLNEMTDPRVRHAYMYHL